MPKVFFLRVAIKHMAKFHPTAPYIRRTRRAGASEQSNRNTSRGFSVATSARIGTFRATSRGRRKRQWHPSAPRPVISILPELENGTVVSLDPDPTSAQFTGTFGRGADPIWLLISISLAAQDETYSYVFLEEEGERRRGGVVWAE